MAGEILRRPGELSSSELRRHGEARTHMNRDEFATLSLSYLEEVNAYAHRLCRREWDADDLVQAAFEQAFRKWDDLAEPGNCRVRIWPRRFFAITQPRWSLLRVSGISLPIWLVQVRTALKDQRNISTDTELVRTMVVVVLPRMKARIGE